MDKKIAALLGAAAAVATAGGAQAASQPGPSGTLHASSYADLLAPIPNAVQKLRADDAARAQNTAGDVRVAETTIIKSGRQHHHHHHHHHQNTVIGVPGVGGVTVGSGHHHHHHHQTTTTTTIQRR